MSIGMSGRCLSLLFLFVGFVDHGVLKSVHCNCTRMDGIYQDSVQRSKNLLHVNCTGNCVFCSILVRQPD